MKNIINLFTFPLLTILGFNSCASIPLKIGESENNSTYTVSYLFEHDGCMDKFAKAGFHAVKSEFVNAPVIEELPMTLECELVSYDQESNHLVGRIVNVSAAEDILDENGQIDPSRLNPITYDPIHHHYLVIGEKVGNAFSDGKALK